MVSIVTATPDHLAHEIVLVLDVGNGVGRERPRDGDYCSGMKAFSG
jgi:hypothetical protein